MASPVWAKGIIRPEVDVDDPPMVCLPPDPMLIKGKQAGTIAEYIYIYTSGSQCKFMHLGPGP